MTNFEKWAMEVGYHLPRRKMDIICLNSKCEDCPIYKKFRICECDEDKIEKWLESEVDDNE